MDYARHLLVVVTIWLSLALSQGLITGYLGILAVHQAAAWAIGAYVAALLNQTFGAPLWATLLPSGVIAALVMGGLTVSVAGGRRDDQVTASLCLQVVLIGLINNLRDVTGGPFGIAGIGGGSASLSARDYAALSSGGLVLAATMGAYLLLRRGRLAGEWLLLRDDRTFAESLGINARAARLGAAALAAGVAGAAGAVFAFFLTYIDPSAFGLAESVAILAIAVIGQAPSIAGVIAATICLVLAPELLRTIGIGAQWMANARQGLFGAVLIAAVWFARRR